MEDVRYWKIAPGDGAWQWPECRDRGFIAVGWNEIGDVSGMTKEEFDAAVDAAAERDPAAIRTGGASQLWQFANIKPGDRIVANKGLRKVLGIGTVTGPYAFLASETRHAHRLPVRWDDTAEREYDAGRAWQWTIRELSAEQFDAILNAPPAAPPAAPVFRPEPAAVPWPEYTLEQLSAETGLDPETLARWTRAIHRKGQAILSGPPGTGKTFAAERLARHLASGGFGLVETVQFHPAYAYEDFIAGIRPRSDGDGGLEYPLVDGVFVDFCARATEREGLSVLIVDEINRANLARVFGELMFLLEYRDRTVNLAGGRAFSIPENVRLLGTMNTADRSIALVDHALRRRFAFLALAPDYQVLARYHERTGFDSSGLVSVLSNLNRAIDDPHYEVGISFFLIDDLADSLEDVWRMEIEPYVEEYFFDRRARFEEFRWDKVRREILGPEQP